MPESVSLREITKETVRAIIKLEVAESQKGLVAPNAVSLAQALFEPAAWYRAVYRGELPVGFVMLEDQLKASSPPAKPELWIWRFMIDHRFQHQGVGSAAIALVIRHAIGLGQYQRLLLSYVPIAGSAEPFYRGLGFEPTGEVEDGEVILQLPLRARSAT